MKTFEIYKNGTVQGEVKAKNLKDAKKKVLAYYGENRFLHELQEEGNVICDHDFVPLNNDGKHKCRFCGEIEN